MICTELPDTICMGTPCRRFAPETSRCRWFPRYMLCAVWRIANLFLDMRCASAQARSLAANGDAAVHASPAWPRQSAPRGLHRLRPRAGWSDPLRRAAARPPHTKVATLSSQTRHGGATVPKLRSLLAVFQPQVLCHLVRLARGVADVAQPGGQGAKWYRALSHAPCPLRRRAAFGSANRTMPLSMVASAHGNGARLEYRNAVAGNEAPNWVPDPRWRRPSGRPPEYACGTPHMVQAARRRRCHTTLSRTKARPWVSRPQYVEPPARCKRRWQAACMIRTRSKYPRELAHWCRGLSASDSGVTCCGK